MALTDNLELAVQYRQTDIAQHILMNTLGTNDIPLDEQQLRQRLLEKVRKEKPPPRRMQQDVRFLRVKYKWDEYGHCNYYTRYSSDEEIEVPLSVIREGFEAVREYILENVEYDGESQETDYDDFDLDGRDNEEFRWDDVENQVDNILEEVGGNDD
ncbi:MAG: hypothetical protein FJ218_10455 [Ignavibacteria bacterium]|nr:hypothetical protein [Ignavibacteria bacterium]